MTRVRRSPLRLDKLTPEMAADLANAQASCQTVGKDGHNSQNRYNYATADAMIRASRLPLGNNGLSLISTWSVRPADAPPAGDIGNQFIGGRVRLHWVLLHKSGGMIRGWCEIDAICSRARPTDKAAMAAATFARGFILRDLLNLDRAEETGDDVDQREEHGDFVPHGRQSTSNGWKSNQRPSAKEQAKQAANAAAGGKLTPASELPRGDDGNWQQWTQPPADVLEAIEKGEPHTWYVSAWKALRHRFGARDIDSTRALIRYLTPSGTQPLEPGDVVSDPSLANVMWNRLLDAHKGGEVPFGAIVKAALKAAEAAAPTGQQELIDTSGNGPYPG